jgi:pyrroline-5-carboxylate reductase
MSDGVFDLVLVGGGNMGAALLGGLLERDAAAGQEPTRVAVVDVLPERRSELAARFPAAAVLADVPEAVGAVIAVKPGDAPAAATAAARAGARRILSIAAGVRLATLQDATGPGVAVIRAMPNTPALVRLGASAIAADPAVADGDLRWAEAVLGAVGTVDRVEESALDVFTGFAGSGPAYVFLVAEALTDAAVSEGLDREIAERVVRQLLLGAATLLDREGDPVALRAQVTSPGGTTAAGIAALESHDLRGAVAAALHAATERSRELG